MMDFAGRAKYDAWKKLEGTPAERAKADYVSLVNSLLPQGNSTSGQQKSASPSILVTKEPNNRVYRIEWNRPDKFNAITWEMYEAVIDALRTANEDPDNSVTVITGRGPYYCSGNDLSNFMVKGREDLEKVGGENCTTKQT